MRLLLTSLASMCLLLGLVGPPSAQAPTHQANPVPAVRRYEVKYRCPEGKEKSFTNQNEALKLRNELRRLEFQTVLRYHAGTYTVQFHLPEWHERIHFGLVSFAKAQALQTRLKGLGC